MSTRYPFAVIKEKLHARRGELADFAIGARKVPLAAELSDWIHANAGLALRVAGPDEVAEFKTAAALFLHSTYDADVSVEHILPVPGGRAGMSAFIACVVEPGAGVLTTEPGYPAFARMALHRHARPITAYLDPDRDFAPAVDAITEQEQLSVIALNYPNNPTAAVLTKQTRALVADLAEAHQAVLFNDAVYGPLTYVGHASCLLSDRGAWGDGPQFVELHSLTKLYPLGPLSGSFLVGTAETMHDIATYSEFAWAPMSALQIGATTWCLRDEEGRLHIRDFFARQLAQLRGILDELGFSVFPTPSGIYALCRVPTKLAGIDVDSAASAAAILMDRFGIAAMPWDLPDYSFLRFCSLYADEDLEKLAELKGRL